MSASNADKSQPTGTVSWWHHSSSWDGNNVGVKRLARCRKLNTKRYQNYDNEILLRYEANYYHVGSTNHKPIFSVGVTDQIQMINTFTEINILIRPLKKQTHKASASWIFESPVTWGLYSVRPLHQAVAMRHHIQASEFSYTDKIQAFVELMTE